MRFAVLVVLLVGCAENIHVRYPALPEESTGTLVLALTQPASDVSVAINGVLVVDDAHTQKITIDGVPVGTQEVILAANGGDKQFRVWIGGERPTTVPLGVPDSGAGFLKSLFGTLVTLVAY